jgi:hypothetical protein
LIKRQSEMISKMTHVKRQVVWQIIGAFFKVNLDDSSFLAVYKNTYSAIRVIDAMNKQVITVKTKPIMVIAS